MKKAKMFIRKACGLSLCFGLFLTNVYAKSYETDTGVNVTVNAIGRYVNWDGVSNVTQFLGADGNLWFAVDAGDSVNVYKTNKDAAITNMVPLAKQHPLYGTTIVDDNGNYYVVTGEQNKDNDTSVETIFISKYDSHGSLIATVGDNGSSSLDWYYGDSFYTQIPFNAGNCDAVICNDVLTVHYARTMYSGHQSNSIFTINTKDMSKIDAGAFYESHSFAQRAVPTDKGFVYMSEGDCYDRAFKTYCIEFKNPSTSDYSLTYSNEQTVFDFWVEDGALDSYNMFVVNNNFAHMGGIAYLSNGNIAFVAQSVKSLNEKAANEKEEVFIQIFDPKADLSSPKAYVTKGERSGLAGNNGRDKVTNYGVKWLTSYGSNYSVSNVQMVATDMDQIVVLYELMNQNEYVGVYYIVLDAEGNVLKDAMPFNKEARLNPCEMPVYVNGAVSWAANSYSDSDRLYVYTLYPEGSPDFIEGLHCAWNEINSKLFWYEDGYKQGTYTDAKGVMGDNTIRGREIYDPASDAWYWLDSVYDGAKAVGKEVWIPYIYQDEDKWNSEQKRTIAYESDNGMGDLVLSFMNQKMGKWVRYDENGHMIKGWVTITGPLAQYYPKQAGNTYYYDHRTGLMAKGRVKIDGIDHFFNETTGVLEW